MDKQKQLYQAKHKDDSNSGASMATFNGGIKGMMAGVIAGFIYHTYRPSDFLVYYMDQYFEVYIVACAILGYIVGSIAGAVFYTED